MSNWFNQIWTWVSINRDEVDLVIGAAIFVFVLVSQIFTIKNKKAVTEVKDVVAKLGEIVDDYADIRSELNKMKEVLDNYDVTTNKSVDKMINVQDIDTQLLKKLNTVLDIMGLAYSTVKNDEIRVGIANLINYAKYLDPTNKLIQERENERTNERRQEAYARIKNNLKSNVEKLRKQHDAPAETVQPTQPATPVKSKNDIIQRY
jgi:hypothetical protein